MSRSHFSRVILSLALVTIQCSIYESATPDNPENPVPSDAEPKREEHGELSPAQEFVATENLPVWTAYRPDGFNSVTYLPQWQGIVKEAFDYLKSNDFQGLSAVGHKTIGDELKESLSSTFDKISSTLRRLFRHSHRTVTGNGSVMDPMGDRYLSILIMMDYGGTYRENQTMLNMLIKQRIVYASTFWDAVQLQLSKIQNPKVHLRPSGIVIGLNKEATPYVYNNRRDNSVLMHEAYESMLKYWALPSINAENKFPLDGYHVVVTMTNSTPGGLSRPHAKSSFGIRCDSNSDSNAGLIFYDDLGFTGIPLAVRGIAHILGATIHDGTSGNCPLEGGYVMSRGRQFIGRKWADCSLQEISQHLKNHGSCLKKPREFQPAGKPIPFILPGDVMTKRQLCRARGWIDGEVCYELTTCEKLYCCNKNILSVCTDSGHTPDGTWLNSTRRCLDGKALRVRRN